jgi:hypothetical protein
MIKPPTWWSRSNDPPKPQKQVKPLNAEMAVRHKRALQRLLDDGDI